MGGGAPEDPVSGPRLLEPLGPAEEPGGREAVHVLPVLLLPRSLLALSVSPLGPRFLGAPARPTGHTRALAVPRLAVRDAVPPGQCADLHRGILGREKCAVLCDPGW